MSYSETSKKSARPNMTGEKRILLVDDHVDSLVPLNLILGNLGISVNLVFDGFAARRALQSRAFDLVVIDWSMPNLNGGESLALADAALADRLGQNARVPFVIYSGLRETEIALPELQNFQCIGFWRKPMLLSQLTQRLTSILERLEKAS